MFLLAAEAPDLPFLQHPQQLHLKRGRHFRDLVQKQRPLVCQFKATVPPLDRARECAALVPEQLTFEESLRDGRAVDPDKRVRAADAELVKGLGDELLPCAGLTKHEHRSIRRRRLLDHAVHTSNARGIADDPSEASMVVKLPPERFDFAQSVLTLRHILKQNPQPLRIDRLRQVVVCALLHGHHGGVDASLRGNQNEGEVGQLILDPPEQIQAIQSRHHEIGEDRRRAK